MRTALVALAAALALPACASRSSTPEPAPVAAEPLQEGHLPTPYTAEEIRDRCVMGHRRVWRMEAPGRAPWLSHMVFVATDAEGALLRSRSTTLDGAAMGEAQQQRGTWAEYQSHASFPADATTVEPAVAETHAGDFPSRLYTIRHGDSVVRMWFADDHAGPPVRMERRTGDAVTLEMVLVAIADGPMDAGCAGCARCADKAACTPKGCAGCARCGGR